MLLKISLPLSDGISVEMYDILLDLLGTTLRMAYIDLDTSYRASFHAFLIRVPLYFSYIQEGKRREKCSHLGTSSRYSGKCNNLWKKSYY